MSLQQKLRLLSHWIPAGLPSFEQGKRTYLHLRDVPYEFESPLIRWLEFHPELLEQSSEDCVLIEGPKGLAIDEHGWSEFVRWIVLTMEAKLGEMAEEEYQNAP